MPAAPSALITALRAGTCVRHMFFKMTHDDGDVLAWDGVGDFDFNGDTYLGVAGLAEIGGVSNSSDIQNHAVTVRLNGVPLSAFRGVSPSIRNQTAELYAVWISTETGIVLASKLVFAGLGDFLTTRLADETISLTATIRAPHSDWSVIPRAYYTSADQSRLHPGDTGCDYTSALENAVIAGWQATAQTATALLYYKANLSIYRHIADGSGNLYGHPTYGCIFQVGSGQELLGANSVNTYKDGTLNNSVLFQSVGQALQCHGVSVQLDGSLNAISADGNPITRAGTGSAGDKLRKITAITSDGAASGAAAKYTSILGKDMLYDPTAGVSGENYSGLYFPASGAHYASRNAAALTFFGGSAYPFIRSDGVIYYEQGTSNPLIQYTSGNVRVMRGVNNLVSVVKSANGVLLTSDTLKRVVAGSGSGYDAESYLRVWT